MIVLEPLSESDAETLLAGLGADLDDATRERVLHSAEGNPLYVEQLAALAGSGEVVVPPTIQALLAERLDRLDADERAILERAAVVGQEFSRRIVTDLCPPELRGDVGRHLLALVRKELIRPHASASSARGQLPLPPRAHPRRHLRRHAEGGTCALPRVVRRLDRAQRRRPR